MTDKTELQGLLPCPCGNPKVMIYPGDSSGKRFIACDDQDCSFDVCGYSDEQVTAKWNRRPFATRAPGAVAEGGRYFCSGPEGHFWCDDLGLATMILAEFDKDDEWTVTDTADAAPKPAESKPDKDYPSDAAVARLGHELFAKQLIRADQSDKVVQELAMIVRGLCYALSKRAPEHSALKKARDYLAAHGLQGSILREEAKPAEPVVTVPRDALAEVLRISDRDHEAWNTLKAALRGEGVSNG